MTVKLEKEETNGRNRIPVKLVEQGAQFEKVGGQKKGPHPSRAEEAPPWHLTEMWKAGHVPAHHCGTTEPCSARTSTKIAIDFKSPPLKKQPNTSQGVGKPESAMH
jgi:hypothetical protein